jgi:hypothetical protein
MFVMVPFFSHVRFLFAKGVLVVWGGAIFLAFYVCNCGICRHFIVVFVAILYLQLCHFIVGFCRIFVAFLSHVRFLFAKGVG